MEREEQIQSHSDAWFALRRFRITASNAKKAISASDYFMSNIDPDGNSYYIGFGHKVEIAILFVFKELLIEGKYKVDNTLYWLSATSDAMLNVGDMCVPVEIKTTKNKTSVEALTKQHYHQLNIIMRVFMTPYLILIVYYERLESFSFYRIFKDDEYENKYLALIERGFYMHLVKYLCSTINEFEFAKILQTKSFQQKFLQYYKGDFESDLKNQKRYPKVIEYEQIRPSDLFGQQSIKQRLKTLNSEFSLKVRRRKLFYRDFERLYNEKSQDLYRDYQIQALVVKLVNQLI